MVTTGHDQRRALPTEAIRLVLAGFVTPHHLWRTYEDLIANQLTDDQICVFGLASALQPPAAMPHIASASLRTVNDLRLRVFSPQLFDDVSMEGAGMTDGDDDWMPAAQARILWGHIRGRMSVLCVRATSPEQQLACSRIQLRHQPEFVHTFDFSR
jgi:hypothetical protein